MILAKVVFLLGLSTCTLVEQGDFLGIKITDKKVIIADFGENKGFGLIATQDIAKGEAIVSLPLNYTYTALSEFPMFSYISDLEFHTITAVHLLWDKTSDQGFFKDFAKSFLGDYNLLLFWTPHQKRVLDDYALQVFEHVFYGLDWESEYEIVKKRLENVDGVPSGIFNFTEWKWAYSCAVAKTFDIWADKWERAVGTQVTYQDYSKFITFNIPILDLANHAHVPLKDRKDMIYYLEEYDGKVHLIAQNDHAKGHEILFEYENEGNIVMLNKFGFALEKNFLEEFLYNKTTEKCTEKKISPQQCQWVLRPYEANKRLLEYFRNEKKDEILALVSYRNDMKQILSSAKYPLREIRRVKNNYNWKYHSAFNYGLCQRLLIHEHIKFTDREILKTYLGKLHLI